MFEDTAGENLMPKICFITDKVEAEEAAKIGRSNPFREFSTVFPPDRVLRASSIGTPRLSLEQKRRKKVF